VGRLRRWLAVAGLTTLALAAGGALAVKADIDRASGQAVKPITEQEAIADAMKSLPDDGAGFQVVATQFEPSSKGFEFSYPGGSFGEQDGMECLTIWPLPRLPFSPCRYHPVWVVAMSSQSCEVVVAIHAYTGQFGGGGGGDGVRAGTVQSDSAAPSPPRACDLMPGAGETNGQPPWGQPYWG
jgi:hypothetical protein